MQWLNENDDVSLEYLNGAFKRDKQDEVSLCSFPAHFTESHFYTPASAGASEMYYAMSIMYRNILHTIMYRNIYIHFGIYFLANSKAYDPSHNHYDKLSLHTVIFLPI